MWRQQVKIGIVPYYMFVERDTGPRHYFQVPLWRAWQTYRDAVAQVSGLARTARGPIMSATEGKVEVLGLIDQDESFLFLLQFLQARDPFLVRRPFFATGKRNAVWYDELKQISAGSSVARLP
jgi:L-lysine 2,3-aminomutase